MQNSILGDSGATKPRQTNNLGGNNVQFQPNIFQTLSIDQNFFNSEYAEHYMIGANDNSTVPISDGYMQFNTKGWVRADKLCLTVPIEFTYNWRNASNQNLTNINILSQWPELATLQLGYSGASSALCFTTERLKLAWHPRFAMLEVFEKIEVMVGNNFQPVQKAYETTVPGLKHNMATHRFGKVVAKVMTQWGLPYTTFNSKTLLQNRDIVGLKVENSDPLTFDYKNYETVYSENEVLVNVGMEWWADSYCSFLHTICAKTNDIRLGYYLSNNITPYQNATEPNQANLPRNSYEIKIRRELILPLQCIVNFFREPRYLPPDFRLNVKFEKSNFNPFICVSSAFGECPGVNVDFLPVKETQLTVGALESNTPSFDVMNAGVFTEPVHPLGRDMFSFRQNFLFPNSNYNSSTDVFTGAPSYLTRMQYYRQYGSQTPLYEAARWLLPHIEANLDTYGTFDLSGAFDQFQIATGQSSAVAVAGRNSLISWVQNTRLNALLFSLFNTKETALNRTDNKQIFLTDFYIRADLKLEQIRLTYPWHVLKQDLQASMVTAWLTKPYLYNYESTESYEISLVDGQKNVSANIAINSQRPTVLYFMLLAVNNYNWPENENDWSDTSPVKSFLIQHRYHRNFMLTKNFNHTAATTNPSTYVPDGADVFSGVGSFGRPEYDTFKLVGRRDLIYKANEPVSTRIINSKETGAALDDSEIITWQNFEIRFSGRTALRFRNDKMSNKSIGNFHMTAYDYFNNLEFDSAYQRYCSENVTLSIESSLNYAYNNNTIYDPFLLKCVINPGGFAERGYLTGLQGAVNIQISIDFLNDLSSDYKIVVLRTNPEQLIFDAEKNATIVQWPTLKTRAGYIIPNITFAN